MTISVLQPRGRFDTRGGRSAAPVPTVREQARSRSRRRRRRDVGEAPVEAGPPAALHITVVREPRESWSVTAMPLPLALS